MDPKFINAMVLAYLGDSVLELLVREYLIKESELVKPKDLQSKAIEFVSAKGQMDFMIYARESELLTEEEIDIYKRGRNTKNTKNETKEHRHSTGFEAILGHYNILENHTRINEIFELYKDFINNK